MTKKELEAENERLGKEIAALRDLLAAISAVADTVPVSKDCDWAAEWKRSVHVLANIKGLSKPGDWAGFLAYAAGELRRIAAEPVGYEVYAEPEPEHNCPATAVDGKVGKFHCTRETGHDGPHFDGPVQFPEPASPDAVAVLAGSIDSGTPVVVTP